jgi:hypothetical protein
MGDRRMVRLVRKWLKVGVMEEGQVTPGTVGTPRGAVVSPLLANICLHYVLDLWARQWRHRHAQGNVIMVRYADDLVAGFEYRTDAERFLAALRERLESFALSLHPDKTRLIEFGCHAAANRARRGLGKLETFDFLGFTHICGRTRNGKFSLHRKTRRDRLRAKLREVKETLRRRLHAAIDEQGARVRQVVTDYFAYHAVPNNIQALSAFRRGVRWLWWRSLRRRSQNDRTTRTVINGLVHSGFPSPASPILGPNSASPSPTRGGSRMPELGTSGSVRGCAVMRIPTATNRRLFGQPATRAPVPASCKTRDRD